MKKVGVVFKKIMINLPDMSDVLLDWEQDVTVSAVTTATVDFIKQAPVVVPRTQKMVVQVAQAETLNTDTVDWSLRYLQVHSREALTKGEYILYNANYYKVITCNNYLDYGYFESTAEEFKGDITEVS